MFSWGPTAVATRVWALPGILTSCLSQEHCVDQYQNSTQAECGHPFRLSGQSTAAGLAESEREAVVCKPCPS